MLEVKPGVPLYDQQVGWNGWSITTFLPRSSTLVNGVTWWLCDVVTVRERDSRVWHLETALPEAHLGLLFEAL